MNKKEVMEQFEKNVAYLRKVIPPDDIYAFAEQSLIASLYFLHRWNEWEDLDEICRKEKVTRSHVYNILGLMKARDKNADFILDLNLDWTDYDEDEEVDENSD